VSRSLQIGVDCTLIWHVLTEL